MNKTCATLLLSICFLPLLHAADASAEGTTPQDVIKRLVANAEKNPPGPVENDLTSQRLNFISVQLARKKNFSNTHDALASDYNFITFDGPLTSIYEKDNAAMFSAKVKLSAAVVKGDPAQLPISADGGPGFSLEGGWQYLNSKPKEDVIATFCLVQQSGAWKVHFMYISNAPLTDKQKDFISNTLNHFANKP